MLKTKSAQGMSITVIIVAIIALIVLVAVIMIFSGKFDDFRSGIGKAVTCEDACKVIGADRHSSQLPSNCGTSTNPVEKIISGAYSDITFQNNVCCCIYEK